MEHKRGSLVPVAEVVSGLGGPVKAIREASPQALHHFTRFDQVNQLVGASEADPDMGFMARMMVLCSLPRTNPGDRKEYVRRNGPYALVMSAGGLNKLPFGNIPRLLLAWVSTEAVRTRSRELILGARLALGIHAEAGHGSVRRWQPGRPDPAPQPDGPSVQRPRLADLRGRERGKATVNSQIADGTELWWNPKRPDEQTPVGEQDRAGREVLPRNHPPPRAAGHEHPQGPQAVLAGPRSVPLVGLPHLYASCSATALLEAVVPTVRIGTHQGERQKHSKPLPYARLARVEERSSWPGRL